MDYEMLIRCVPDTEGGRYLTLVAANDFTEGDFIMEPGDFMVFTIDSHGEISPGDYVTIVIPREGIVAPEDQLTRVVPASPRRIEIQKQRDDDDANDEPQDENDFEPFDVRVTVMLYSETCGCSCLVDGDNYAGPKPKPIVRRKRRKASK